MLYVDNMKIPFGRMKMNHLVADSHKELVQATVNLGISTKHIQHLGEAKEHLDVCMSKRKIAIRDLGAKEITGRELVEIVRSKQG